MKIGETLRQRERNALKSDRIINPKYIDVLDGIRAISIIIVLVFHFWQQTWIWPCINTPWLSIIGITQINLSNYAKAGYLFVDMMVLISGFLLFLPLARQIFMDESMNSWKEYAKKRIARIVPSYLLCIIVLFAYNILIDKYTDPVFAAKDLLTHLTFTQVLYAETYMSTKLNVVLWTVNVEVWFYILYPFIASFIKRRGKDTKAIIFSIVKACAVAIAMYSVFYLYAWKFVFQEGASLSMTINQLPAFFSVYASGMLGAFAFVLIAYKQERTPLLAYINLLIAILSIVAVDKLISSCAAVNGTDAQQWQVENRTLLAMVFNVLIISLALSPKWVRWIFSNRFMRFLSGISYNLYIWHQWLAVELKYTWRIPSWEGTTPPNQLSDKVWMNKYAVIITAAAFAVAVIVTYLVEKPCSNLILGKPVFKGARNKRVSTSEHIVGT